ncbi:MAG: zf-TFIIB domain-containing protein [Kofleriaceae bacterium]
MTDAYRAGGFACPVCPAAALREFAGRLVCDACGGMLIAVDDLAASIGEVADAAADAADAVRFADDAPAARGCPRCQAPLCASAVTLAGLRSPERLLRCAHHGVWLPRDTMVAVFARLGRRAGGRFRALGVGGAGGRAGTSGVGGAMEAIGAAFGSGGQLAISRQRLRRPRVHTLFVSAFHGQRLGCPACADAALGCQGDRWVCARCAGCFVEDAALVAMVTAMASAPWDLPPVAGPPGLRPCPVCATAMMTERLEGVAIDRCAAHGVWFDDAELQAALLHVGAEPPGLGGWLKRLFGRGASTAR